mgnify:FL=1
MRKTIYAKMTALPVGLCALAFAVTSCGSSEYKKLPTMKVSKWPLPAGKRLFGLPL